MSAKANPATLEQLQAMANPLHPAFAALALSFGIVMQDAKYGELKVGALEGLIGDCEELLALVKSLRAQFREVQS